MAGSRIKGQVSKIIADRITVLADGKYFQATLRGRVRREEDVFVGDNVICERAGGILAISEVLPRKTVLIRPFAANIDACLILVAAEPEPDLVLADKVILNCFKEGIEPVLVYNKADIACKESIDAVLKDYAFIDCVALSAATGQGVLSLTPFVKGRLVCLAGQSAVGKTSLLNAILGTELRTGGLSERIKRGKNTTRHIEIFPALGGQIMDTCGFSAILASEMDERELAAYYEDFLPHAAGCKFKSCTHTAEPDCAVRAAAACGALASGRYERYLFIFNELKERRIKKYGG